MKKSWIERGREVLGIEIEALQSVSERLGGSFTEAVELLGSCKGRVVVTGIGKSGLVGRKLAATFSSTGTPAFFLHPVEGAHGDLGSIRDGDVVIAISYSGKSEELNAILPALKSLGARIIAMTASKTERLAHLADIVLDTTVPREACPLNLAPTSSTTATLALGDALAVCLIDLKAFTANDFKRYHPAGALGQRLALLAEDIMHTQNLPLAKEQLSTEEALQVLDKGRLGAVLVVNENKNLLGILTDGDVRRHVTRGTLNLNLPVANIMTKNPVCAREKQSAAEVIDIMEQKTITVLPVLGVEGTLCGLVHLHDLLGKGQIKFAS